MKRGLRRVLKSGGAMLCMALTLIFAQAMVASAVGEVEHLFVGHHAHQHMLFSDITLDFSDHAAHGVTHPDADEDAPGHHHNHNDLGSSSFLVAAIPVFLPLRVGVTKAPEAGSTMTAIRLSLPERPPRTGYIRL